MFVKTGNMHNNLCWCPVKKQLNA